MGHHRGSFIPRRCTNPVSGFAMIHRQITKTRSIWEWHFVFLAIFGCSAITENRLLGGPRTRLPASILKNVIPLWSRIDDVLQGDAPPSGDPGQLKPVSYLPDVTLMVTLPRTMMTRTDKFAIDHLHWPIVCICSWLMYRVTHYGV